MDNVDILPRFLDAVEILSANTILNCGLRLSSYLLSWFYHSREGRTKGIQSPALYLG